MRIWSDCAVVSSPDACFVVYAMRGRLSDSELSEPVLPLKPEGSFERRLTVTGDTPWRVLRRQP